VTIKVVTVVGARPQFIKAAPVSRALAAAGIDEIVVHSGQHYDDTMSRVFFDELAIPAPRYNLNIGSGSHALQTGQIMIALEPLLQEIGPDWVLVYGDTNTTIAAALAAVKLHLPVAHVEAGLRSRNMAMPEEINRIVTDRVSTLLFAPTGGAVDNLLKEGTPSAQVVLSGDVMFDAALIFRRSADAHSQILTRLGLDPEGYILATIHRAENTDDAVKLAAILRGLGEVELPVCLPLHPRTAKRLKEEGIAVPASVRIVEPVGYLDMLRLLSNARLVVTDSGGVQKEAYFCRKPCVTVRSETEWCELVDAGWNRLVPPHSAAAVRDGVLDSLAGGAPPAAPDFYGDGNASGLIAAGLKAFKAVAAR
jgi:UDP-GlcNAc3NAcA epimerase